MHKFTFKQLLLVAQCGLGKPILTPGCMTVNEAASHQILASSVEVPRSSKELTPQVWNLLLMRAGRQLAGQTVLLPYDLSVTTALFAKLPFKPCSKLLSISRLPKLRTPARNVLRKSLLSLPVSKIKCSTFH